MPKKSPSVKRSRRGTRRQPSRACAPRPPAPSFLSLPPELRVSVYSLLFRLPHAIDVAGVWHQKPTLDLSMFRVNKQISAEATHYFYGANTFILLEKCGDYRSDNDHLYENPAYKWLLQIGLRNSFSLRNIHLHPRLERPTGYYTTSYLPSLASLAPNLTRLALVPESHQACDAAFLRLYPRRQRHHNRVVPLSQQQMRQLADALKDNFRGFTVVQIGGAQEKGEMDWLFVRLGGGVRVQGIEGAVAWRGTFGVTGRLWEGMDKSTRWYDAVPGGVVEGGGGHDLKVAEEKKEKPKGDEKDKKDEEK